MKNSLTGRGLRFTRTYSLRHNGVVLFDVLKKPLAPYVVINQSNSKKDDMRKIREI